MWDEDGRDLNTLAQLTTHAHLNQFNITQFNITQFTACSGRLSGSRPPDLHHLPLWCSSQ